MYYVMRVSAPSLHRESTDSLIIIFYSLVFHLIKPCHLRKQLIKHLLRIKLHNIPNNYYNNNIM